jgi:GTP-binding protein
MRPMPLPLVAIVGRPNVGKSTLFNAMLGERVSIVDATAGTTRDRIAAVLKHEGRAVEIVDTGGLGLVDESRLEDHINAQIDLAIAEAEVVVFLVDVREGVTSLDKPSPSSTTPRSSTPSASASRSRCPRAIG